MLDAWTRVSVRLRTRAPALFTAIECDDESGLALGVQGSGAGLGMAVKIEMEAGVYALLLERLSVCCRTHVLHWSVLL